MVNGLRYSQKMRELHGVMFDEYPFPGPKLKRQALLFDRFHVLDLDKWTPRFPDHAQAGATIDFLRRHGVLLNLELEPRRFAYEYTDGKSGWYDTCLSGVPPDQLKDHNAVSGIVFDHVVRFQASLLSNKNKKSDYTPICKLALPKVLPTGGSARAMHYDPVLQVALNSFPMPDEDCPWQDILDFKIEMRDKQWHFRHFLSDLATKQQTTSEIKDHLRWSLNEYEQGMSRRKIKIVRSAVAAFVIPGADLIFNSGGNHVAAILGAAIAINRIGVELLEGEMKAPGRECAYVFDARKRFGSV